LDGAQSRHIKGFVMRKESMLCMICLYAWIGVEEGYACYRLAKQLVGV